MNTDLLNRKGARKLSEIPEEVLSHLNQGKIPTVNLTEWLAIDHVQLIRNTFPAIGLEEALPMLEDHLFRLAKTIAMSCTKLIGNELAKYCEARDEMMAAYNKLSIHPSDSLRCYAPYLVALNLELSFEKQLEAVQPSAADKHFGVREIAWLAMRPNIDANLEEAIRVLSKWAEHSDENVRRFSTESTRPCGVWCKHIERLKKEPELALPILELLKNDPSKYVQDSLGNWLNDASKSRPDFVLELIEKWKSQSSGKPLERISQKALRSLSK